MKAYIQYLKYCVQENWEVIQELRSEKRKVGDLPDEIERLEMFISALERRIY